MIINNLKKTSYILCIHYQNCKMDEEYNSDEEMNNMREYSKISHLKLQDYLDCKETFNILNNEWEYKLEDELEPEVDKIFNDYFNHFKEEDCKLFKRASSIHCVDFNNMIKHHLVRDYNLEIFKDEPSLAKPLLNSLDVIYEERRKNKQLSFQENFNKYNKTYNWGK